MAIASSTSSPLLNTIRLSRGSIFRERYLSIIRSRLLVVVAAVHPQALEHIGIILREIEAENAPAVCIIEKCAERTRYVLAHTSMAIWFAICGPYMPAIAHTSSWAIVPTGSKVVLHGQIHIARTYEYTTPVGTAPRTVAHRPHGSVLRIERRTTARAEVAEHTSGIEHAPRLLPRTGIEIVIVERGVKARHHIVKLGNDSEHLHFEQYCLAPAPLKPYLKMPLGIPDSPLQACGRI